MPAILATDGAPMHTDVRIPSSVAIGVHRWQILYCRQILEKEAGASPGEWVSAGRP
ncbi:MAG TPA: hypothetical protein VGP94_15110 [Tepidisphaeraceae bacterium]|nr:hypothetical protein [Tepidisphaeraceae bacterium]